jgi:hypothetical protein
MIAGYLPDGSQMHFPEPMISQQVLLARQGFTLPVPQELGRASPTLYPTSFEALFQGDAYSFVFSDFVMLPAGGSEVHQAASVVAPADSFTASDVGSVFFPSAFQGLDVAVSRFIPTDPCRCQTVSPVFALNYGDSVDGALVPDGLNVALSRFIPTDPCLIVSPIFFGLADGLPVEDLST